MRPYDTGERVGNGMIGCRYGAQLAAVLIGSGVIGMMFAGADICATGGGPGCAYTVHNRTSSQEAQSGGDANVSGAIRCLQLCDPALNSFGSRANSRVSVKFYGSQL